jgi:hypothetical protein
MNLTAESDENHRVDSWRKANCFCCAYWAFKIGLKNFQPAANAVMKNFKDAEHLLRVAAVFLAGITLFLFLRSHFIPRSFGEYGHYRGDAIGEIAAQPVSFAGHGACESCHSEILEKKSAGKHAGVFCEACHGPLAKHADDPASIVPSKLDSAVLCVKCHEENRAKPRWFPQVASKDHSAGLPCDTCHQPHSPLIAAGATP